MAKSDKLAQLQAQIDEIMGGDAQSTPPRVKTPRKVPSNVEHPDSVTLDDAEKAFKRIVALVNASDKSEKQIRQRLELLEFSSQSIDEAVARAREYGFIDDQRFARVLVRSRIAQGKGRAGIERELSSHGIDPLSVDEWSEEEVGCDSSELERALALLDKKPPKAKNQREGAFRKLIQKGYSTSVASSAARIWCERSRCFYDDGSEN